MSKNATRINTLKAHAVLAELQEQARYERNPTLFEADNDLLPGVHQISNHKATPLEQLQARVAKLEAQANHIGDINKMAPPQVATDDELAKTWNTSYVGDCAFNAANRAIYNLGIEHGQAGSPKPPSLKEQALKALERQSVRSIPSLVSNNDCDTIRRALEALPND